MPLMLPSWSYTIQFSYTIRSQWPVSIQEGLEGLLPFSKNCSNVVLVGHDMKSFDVNHLLRHVQELKLKAPFDEAVDGFSDTFPHFKEQYPGHKSYSQGSLVSALAEFCAFKELVENHLGNLVTCSSSLESAWNNFTYLCMKKYKQEHEKSTHLQATNRKHAFDPYPPDFTPTTMGWTDEEADTCSHCHSDKCAACST